MSANIINRPVIDQRCIKQVNASIISNEWENLSNQETEHVFVEQVKHSLENIKRKVDYFKDLRLQDNKLWLFLLVGFIEFDGWD